MPDEKDKDKKVLTLDGLKTLIAEEAERVILAKGFVLKTELKDHIHTELEAVVTKDLKPEFDRQVEKIISKLPGPKGLKDITDDGLKGISPNGGYNCLAEYAKDVYLADLKGAGRPSARFIKWQTDVEQLHDALKAAGTPTLETSDPEQGGYLIPPEFAATLLDKGFQNSNFINLCTKVPMARNQIGMPFIKDFDHTTYVNGAMMAYWTDELGEKGPATKPKFGKTDLKLNKLIVLSYSSDEMLEDSPISMEPLLTQKSGETIGWKIDEAIFRGTGVGQPLGILGAPCRVTVPKEGGQAAATIVALNIIKMYSQFTEKTPASIRWVINKQTIPQLMTMAVAIGTGGQLVWLPANGLAVPPIASLMGIQVVKTEHASVLGTEGDIVLADFSQYLVGQKAGIGAGIQFAKSIHLMFLYDQTAFRYVIRLDGAPWWPTPFTPKRGPQESCFVTLANRA